MENKPEEIKISDEFKRMVQPMIYDELHCLEKEIFQRKAAKIFVFKRTIVDGYEAYEIASRLNLPIKRISISVEIGRAHV